MPPNQTVRRVQQGFEFKPQTAESKAVGDALKKAIAESKVRQEKEKQEATAREELARKKEQKKKDHAKYEKRKNTKKQQEGEGQEEDDEDEDDDDGDNAAAVDRKIGGVRRGRGNSAGKNEEDAEGSEDESDSSSSDDADVPANSANSSIKALLKSKLGEKHSFFKLLSCTNLTGFISELRTFVGKHGVNLLVDVFNEVNTLCATQPFDDVAENMFVQREKAVDAENKKRADARMPALEFKSTIEMLKIEPVDLQMKMIVMAMDNLKKQSKISDEQISQLSFLHNSAKSETLATLFKHICSDPHPVTLPFDVCQHLLLCPAKGSFTAPDGTSHEVDAGKYRIVGPPLTPAFLGKLRAVLHDFSKPGLKGIAGRGIFQQAIERWKDAKNQTERAKYAASNPDITQKAVNVLYGRVNFIARSERKKEGKTKKEAKVKKENGGTSQDASPANQSALPSNQKPSSIKNSSNNNNNNNNNDSACRKLDGGCDDEHQHHWNNGSELGSDMMMMMTSRKNRPSQDSAPDNCFLIDMLLQILENQRRLDRRVTEFDRKLTKLADVATAREFLQAIEHHQGVSDEETLQNLQNCPNLTQAVKFVVGQATHLDQVRGGAKVMENDDEKDLQEE